jgi:hypothetical protein
MAPRKGVTEGDRTMSCFVLEDQAFQNMYRTLGDILDRSERSDISAYALAEGLARAFGTGYRPELERRAEVWLRAAEAANLLAYAERYPKHPVEAAGELDLAGGKVMSRAQFYKTLDCLDYQCSDWSGWEKSPEAATLDALRHALARSVMIESPEYDAADWG